MDGPDGLIQSRPVCKILCNPDAPGVLERSDVDLIYILPLGSRPHLVEPTDMDDLTACANRGGQIALHATCEAAIDTAVDAILALTGEGRA